MNNIEEVKKTYWAWYNNEEGAYRHIYPRRSLVEMCSPDGFKKATKNGEGKIVEVEICQLFPPYQDAQWSDIKEMRDELKEIILLVRQYLCNTEFAEEPFTKEIDPDIFPGKFVDMIIDKTARIVWDEAYAKCVRDNQEVLDKALADKDAECQRILERYAWWQALKERGRVDIYQS